MKDRGYWRNLSPAFIRAEVTERGSTLTRIALDAGLRESSCRQALIRSHIPGEEALARYLGIPAELLFEARYAARAQSSRRRRPAQRKISAAG